jgi:hypothetical protein
MLTGSGLFRKKRVRSLLIFSLLSVLMVLGACAMPGGETGPQELPSALPTVAATAEPTPELTLAATAESTLESVAEPTVESTSEPAAEATPDPTQYFPTPEELERTAQLARNLIDSIPQPISAPAGWVIRPCEGMAPLLCVQTDQGEVGSSELGVYALRTYPNYYPILEKYGIPFGSINVASQAYKEGAPQALEEIASENLASLAEDRAIGRAEWDFIPLEVKPIQFGELPGLQYGFMMTDSEGVVRERVLSHVAFDEDHVYFFVAAYDPGAEWSLPSDEELLTFGSHLLDVIAGLPLPQGNEGQQ